MGGCWISTREQYAGGILLRRGDAYPKAGYDDPSLQPPGSYVWRSLHDAPALMGRGGWVRNRDPIPRPAPKVIDYDLLHGVDIIDEEGTRKAGNTIWELNHKRDREHDPDALYAKQAALMERVKQDKLEAEKAEAAEVHPDGTAGQLRAEAEMRRRKAAEGNGQG